MTPGHRRFDIVGTLALVGNVLIWSVTPVLLKRLTYLDIDPWTANGLRYPFAAVLFWPVLFRAATRRRVDRALLKRALVPAFFAGAGQVFWALAPYYIRASDIGFFVKAALVWALLGSMLFFPEERALLRSRRFWIGLFVGVGGFVALAVERGVLAGEVTPMGLTIILVCSAFFGCYSVSVRRFMRGVPPHLSFGIVSQYVALATVVLMWAFGDVSCVSRLGGEAWVWLGVTAFFGICISHMLFYVSVLRLGASITNSVHLLGPFVTCAVAWLGLGESLSPRGWGAGVALLAGGGVLLWAQELVLARRHAGDLTSD